MQEKQSDYFIKLLESNKDICAWQAITTRKRSAELYNIGDAVDALRYNETENHSLLLQTPATKGDPELLGEARLQGESLTQEEWMIMIDQSVQVSRYLQNPAYEMSPVWETLPQSHTRQNQSCSEKNNPAFADDVFITDESEAMPKLDALHTQLQSAQKSLSACRLAASELFLSSYKTSYINHRGLELNFYSTQVLWDFALLSPDGEQEIHRLKRSRSLAAMNLQETLQQEERLLLAAHGAAAAPCGDMPVVLADEALDTLFDFFLTQASGQALYHKYSSFEQDKNIFKEQDLQVQESLEPLTLRSNPDIEGNLSFIFFDELGYPLQPLTLIENNVLRNFAIDGKFSFYLKRPRTSALSAVEVACGSYSYESFLEDGTLEILRLSTFQPNPISGNFSGEIRLGFLHKNGKRIPVKGGSVSGNQQAFRFARYAHEQVQRENYLGTKGVWFQSLTIAGDT